MLYNEIFKELARERVKYAVTGGIALMLHGVVRFTADLDLIIELSDANVRHFLSVMKKLGYMPKQPVPADDFGNPEMRQTWSTEKNMLVFTFYHPIRPMELVDVFIAEPIPFSEIEKNTIQFVAGDVSISVVSRELLKRLKRLAGRPQDLADMEMLDELDNERHNV